MRTTALAGARWRGLEFFALGNRPSHFQPNISNVTQCRRPLSSTRARHEPKNPFALEALPPKAERRRSNKLRIATTTAIVAALAAAFIFLADPNRKGVKKIFDPPRFTPFTIIKREEVSPNSIILTLRPQTLVNRPRKLLEDPYQASWEKGTWSVEVKQPELQIARSYTPLPPKKGDPTGDLRFLIRKEHKGEVSGYLHRLNAGSQIHLRGPHEEFNVPERVENVVFLAGGTGIAPALQVAYTLLEERQTESEKPRIHIVWASRKRADCEGGVDASNPYGWEGRKTGKIVQELESLQQRHPGQLSVDYLVDEEGKFLDQKRISSLTKAMSTVRGQALSSNMDSQLLFVSGPEGFIKHVAGPKKWEYGTDAQGELGGIVGQLGLGKRWKVWKL
ncbi:hypothetical protein LZ554_006657 [Drepanopeziza brunnea f. sp. 'monogermtubi']|nr:hypothetical protein LZ554_006657 [Drepanopeziza brunnea f. sp. 'monogermtubi']